jgi:hypothetical protein
MNYTIREAQAADEADSAVVFHAATGGRRQVEGPALASAASTPGGRQGATTGAIGASMSDDRRDLINDTCPDTPDTFQD